MAHMRAAPGAGKSTKRIAMITQDFPPEIGGIQTYAFELAKRLGSYYQNFEVLAPHKPGAAQLDKEQPFYTKRLKISNNMLPIRAMVGVPRWIDHKNWDAIFHTQWQTLPSSLLARRKGWKGNIWVAAHARELLFNPYGSIPLMSGAFQAYRRRVLKAVDHFFPVSTYTAGLLGRLGVEESRMSVVHNGTSTERFYPANASGLKKSLHLQDKKLIFSLSRLVPRKGIDTVIEAMKDIARHHPEAHYLILGEGPDRSRLKQLVNRYQLNGHISFMGHVPDRELNSYYNLADLFVMPSRANGYEVEGFGLVFLEANACGKPVIGSRTGGIPDAIVDGQTGYLVPESSPDVLAKYVCELFDDPEKMRRMGQNGLKHVKESATWDHVADQMVNKMDSLLAGS